MKKIYISGKITGLPIGEAIKKFNRSKEFLAKQGDLIPINPMNISPYSEEKTWEDYMLEGIAALLMCDVIYMQKDWEDSKGARIELNIARELGMMVFFEE